MRSSIAAVVLALAAFAQGAAAQVYLRETPPPAVTAAGAIWQLNGEPLFHAGNFYYPAGPTVFFDGRVMVRTGQYRGVPLYADTTLEPYSIVYVPVGGAVMRPYERRREGELAGTVGSRMPSFPLQRDVELSAMTGVLDLITPDIWGLAPDYLPERFGRRYRRGDRDAAPAPTIGTATPAPAPQPFAPSGVITITPGAESAAGRTPTYGNVGAAQRPSAPAEQTGVWIDFDGARWFSAGPAVPLDPSRFERAGELAGFLVYRERGTAGARIFVTVVADGPIAPFERR